MKKPKGLHPYRLKDNPEEKRFAEAWAATCRLGSTLAYLLWEGDQRVRPPEPSDRDHVVAATVMQWLGSPVGQSWLAGLGYERRTDYPPIQSKPCAREVCHWCHKNPIAWCKRHEGGTWEGWCTECHAKTDVPAAFGGEPFTGQAWATECAATITLDIPKPCSRGMWWCRVVHDQAPAEDRR